MVVLARVREVTPKLCQAKAAKETLLGPSGHFGSMQRTGVLAPLPPTSLPRTASQGRQQCLFATHEELCQEGGHFQTGWDLVFPIKLLCCWQLTVNILHQGKR